MSKALFLSNVGNRDLGKDGVALFDNSKENAEQSKKLRAKCNERYYNITGKELTGNFYDYTGDLYLSGTYKKLDLEPILIKDTIDDLQEIYEDSLHIKLLATMQNPPHAQDTYYSAEIIKEWIIRKYALLENNIEIIAIDKNPSDYALMIDEYSKLFDEITECYDDVYLGITGGTSAQITSLILNGTLKWETDVKTIYKQYDKKPQENAVGEILFKKFKNEDYRTYKESEMYLLASNAGKKYGLIEDWEYHKLRALHFKNLFDFEQAINELNEAFNKADIKTKKEIKKEISILRKLEFESTDDLDRNIEKYKLLINLLIDNMESKWKNGDYVDFIGRIFRLEEAILKTIVEKEFKKSMDKYKINGNSDYHGYWELLDENEEVLNYLKENKIIPEKGVNRHSLYYLVKYLIEKKDCKKYNGIMEVIDKLNTNNKTKKTPKKLEKIDNLADLRNKSVIAHGFMGVSKRDIIELYNEDKYNENEIIGDLKRIKIMVNKLI
jgi:hypothetical protein